jgi:Na+/phosphate symporter
MNGEEDLINLGNVGLCLLIILLVLAGGIIFIPSFPQGEKKRLFYLGLIFMSIAMIIFGLAIRNP